MYRLAFGHREGREYHLRLFLLFAFGDETDHPPPYRVEVGLDEITGYLRHPTHLHSQLLTQLSRKTYLHFCLYPFTCFPFSFSTLIAPLPLNVPNHDHSESSYFLFPFYLHTGFPVYLTTCKNPVIFSRKNFPFVLLTWSYKVRETKQFTI
jgi:hypothetical protein